MKTRLIYFMICLMAIGCQDKQPTLNYLHTNEATFFNCDDVNSKIIEEALYEFEASITENYTKAKPSLSFSYGQFLKQMIGNKVNYNNIATKHALEIFEALKGIDGLWVKNGDELKLNYNHEIFKCIGENILDKDIKTTYNALLSTNSMDIRMLKDVIFGYSRKFESDKYFATFVALELYYTKLSNVDLSKKEDPKLHSHDEKEKDPHAGHNH